MTILPCRCGATPTVMTDGPSGEPSGLVIWCECGAVCVSGQDHEATVAEWNAKQDDRWLISWWNPNLGETLVEEFATEAEAIQQFDAWVAAHPWNRYVLARVVRRAKPTQAWPDMLGIKVPEGWTATMSIGGNSGGGGGGPNRAE